MTHATPAEVPRLPFCTRLEYFLYSSLLALALPLLGPYYVLRRWRRKESWRGVRERLGKLPQSIHQSGPGAIWIHAVSVGEVLAVAPLLPLLRQRFPERRILVSTTTDTGQELAASKLPADGTFYNPLDFRFTCRRTFRAVRPALVLIAETEFWPRFLREARLAGARVVVVNGRISDRSFARYYSWRKTMRTVLSHVDCFLMQSEEDARRVQQIGAATERVFVAGNLKYDLGPPAAAPLVTWLEAELARQQRGPVIVAGSVTAGEEAFVLVAFGIVQGQWPRALLVLAPRKPERFDATATLIEEFHLRFVRRSQLSPAALLDVSANVLLLDSVGELAGVYRLADAVFVGGSLVPAGGHNILEPAAFGKPPIFGPWMENFREVAATFLKAGAGIEVRTPEDLGVAWIELIQNAARRGQMGRAARELVERSRGATALSIERIAVILGSCGKNS